MASQIAAVFILALAFLAVGIDTSAATLVVTKTADTADGICDADCSLREAVSAAASGDTVVFSPLFNEPQTITLTFGEIFITQNLTITGPGQNFLTISGNNASRIAQVTNGGSLKLSGMKLINGRASIAGGIGIVDSSLEIRNVMIGYNTASSGTGGGIYAFDATVSVIESSFISNTGTAIYGGGTTSIGVDRGQIIGNSGSAVSNISGPVTVRNSALRNNGAGIGKHSSNGTLTIQHSVISDNSSLGVANIGGTATVSNSVIRNNANDQFGGKGGGVRNTGTMYILDTSIINNIAFEAGGGIYNVLGHLYLTNSTVSGNFVINGTGTSPCPGGGIANIWNETNPGGAVVLTNSTVAGNSAQGAGGGICNQAGGTVTTRNSIIAQNTGTSGADVLGSISSESFNLIGNTTGNSGWTAKDLQNVNPLLAPLGNNGGLTWTHALLPTSPGINAGNNELARDPLSSLLLEFDQRGEEFARVVTGSVDIGAYEANYASSPVTIGGRVLVNSAGRAAAIARVTLTDALGNVRHTQTNPFGYYRFFDLEPGTNYTVGVSHKSYQFDSPQVVTIDQPRDNLDFVAIGH